MSETVIKEACKVNPEELVRLAEEARALSYSPYSHYAVGAALLSADGRVFCGCNVENAAYSPTVCAERVAFFSAIASGAREFRAIAVVGGPAGELPEACTPCGVCRQVMAEFCPPDFPIILRGADGEIRTVRLDGLLPESFSLVK